MMNKKKLFLEVDTSQIDVKQILKKDFLELSMRAISSANPNRNNSWFTKESMEKSIGSFVNKPILGYFENGDFVSHNGDWNHDPETQMDYWDTLGSKGERILGTIRESDEVKIVEDEDGLSWVVFTCVLWTQYCFKQVKRLLKDAKRAQKNGGATKNISVEVDITDYEILDNGVMKINEFNLVGVTILGTRNNVKVEPGIENAELSVTDIMGRDVYCKQEQALRLAYEKLNDSQEPKEEIILENEEKKEEEIISESEVEQKEPVQMEEKPEVEVEQESKEEVCPVCGQNPCICEKEEEKQEQIEEKEEEKAEEAQEEAPVEEEKEEKQEEAHFEEMEEEPQPEPIRDIAWLIDNCSWNIESLKMTAEHYEESETEHKEYIVAVLNRIIARQEESEKDLGILMGKIASGINEEDELYEEKLEKYSDVNELISNYEESVEDLKEKDELIKSKDEIISSYEHKEFMQKAEELINSAKIQDESVVKKFVEDCDNKTINSLEDLKVKVAVYSFDNKQSCEPEEEKLVTPVTKPNVDAAFNSKKAVKKEAVNHWDALHSYINE